MFLEVIKETARGKSLGRILTNRALRGTAVSGNVLEIGKGHVGTRASHWRFLDEKAMTKIVTVDIQEELKPDVVADVCKGLPLADASFDTVMAFNLFEHLSAPEKAAAEMARVLKPGGRLIGSVPFMVGVHADPYDFRRFTRYALEALFKDAGFKGISIRAIGGPFVASYSQIEPFIPKWLRVLKAPCVILIERLLRPLLRGRGGNTPVDYVFTCVK
jgi:SAM-dependent methyltransferase